ncbi:MAG: hypothetical protein O9302_03345 [Cyclobacteriaceae bacterium]|nr:hypothetical protein [Cytophagales bacterium]MCZ8327072.1 hypothetical protein [Cyclobacteriaceae bacterium]
MTDLLNFANRDRRKVTLGYKLANGKIVRVYRKIDGHDAETIKTNIEQLFEQGCLEVLAEVYRPNGSAYKLTRTFIVQKNGGVKSLGNLPKPAPEFFDKTKTPTQTPTPTKTNNNMNDWKDYALAQEKSRVQKLEEEVRRLLNDNRSLDTQVRQFEKDMIKKDFELEKLSSQLNSKSALGGIVDKISESDKAIDVLAGIAGRLFNIETQNQGQALPEGQQNYQPKTQQYIQNIGTWLNKQPEELQDQFYRMIYLTTNDKEVSATILKLINILENGTTISRSA